MHCQHAPRTPRPDVASLHPQIVFRSSAGTSNTARAHKNAAAEPFRGQSFRPRAESPEVATPDAKAPSPSTGPFLKSRIKISQMADFEPKR